MAEILISLTIIGVIAAITLPSLQANINEKTWATQRKALYSRISQAIAMMPSLNGYGVVFEDGSINETATASKAAQAFITDGLSKVLKISNICDNANLKKCGFPDKITKMGINSKINTPTTIISLNYVFNYSNTVINYSQINTNAAAFDTVNGESVLTYYNPNCSYTYGVNGVGGAQNLMQPTMCANFIYDLNGRKGPNKVGKDIGFMTAFYPSDSVFVAPMPVGYTRIESSAEFTIGVGNSVCRKKYGEDTKMANIEELMSVFVNNNLGYIDSSTKYFISGSNYYSSTIAANGLYALLGYSGAINVYTLNQINNNDRKRFFCVKR